LEEKYLECVNTLEQAMLHIKGITTQLEDINKHTVKGAIYEIESGIEILKHELEEELEDQSCVTTVWEEVPYIDSCVETLRHELEKEIK